jgi:ketosteroid isomerase-like protein
MQIKELSMSSQQDKAALRKAIEDWTEAVCARDADKVATFFAPDVVSFDLPPPLKTIGFDGDALRKWFRTWEGPIGYEVADLDITVGGDVAYARSLNRMTGTKVDGEKVDLWTRSTVCFRKEGPDWKVVHVHGSVPMMMDGSKKAATDLKP